MSEGEGEWETVRKARPKFAGHEQPRVPLWGYEDESEPAVMARKIDAAADHGVNVFIFDWYWYENGPFLEETLNRGFLGAGNCDRMQFYIMWANHDATTLWDLERSHTNEVVWPGTADRETFRAATRRLIERYFGHPSYYRIDGKPVLSIYDMSNLINGLGGIEGTRAALEELRADARRAGLPGVHLQAIIWGDAVPAVAVGLTDSTPTRAETLTALGFDSLTNYQWCHCVRPKGPYADWGRAAIARWDDWAREFPIPFYPHVSIGWDTNPRFKALCEDVVTGTTPELFGEFLRRAVEHIDARGLEPRLVTVNSWNEWSEGSYLEPDTTWGMGYLEAVRDALA